MIDIDKVVSEVSKNLRIDEQVVKTICRHVFEYTVNIMRDSDDEKDILFNQLFKFKLKNRFKNKP